MGAVNTSSVQRIFRKNTSWSEGKPIHFLEKPMWYRWAAVFGRTSMPGTKSYSAPASMATRRWIAFPLHQQATSCFNVKRQHARINLCIVNKINFKKREIPWTDSILKKWIKNKQKAIFLFMWASTPTLPTQTHPLLPHHNFPGAFGELSATSSDLTPEVVWGSDKKIFNERESNSISEQRGTEEEGQGSQSLASKEK